MLSKIILNNNLIINSIVQKDPGIIVGPISKFLGTILNFIFNITSNITERNSLGISIIIFTFIVKIILLPLGIKTYKSMLKMQKLQPEIDKINSKYLNMKDQESKNKKNIEIQKLYTENKVNPFGGCLPLFIQLPIFTALFYIMNQPYLFINKIGQFYNNLAIEIMKIPNYQVPILNNHSLGLAKIPKNISLDLLNQNDLLKLLNKFKLSDWQLYLNNIPKEYTQNIENLLDYKTNIEKFLSINLIENAGIFWPTVLIPIIAVITSFLTSYLSTKQTKAKDENSARMQKTMLYVMPIFMGFITLRMPSGVGLYWITSNIFQCIQQVVITNFIFNEENNKKDNKKNNKKDNKIE